MPIIVLSVRRQDAAKVAALDEGADDYITKPFSIQELLARVRVQSRRLAATDEVQESLIELGDFRIDVERHQVMVRGEEIHLTPKEFDLLLYFARNADRVLTHKTLLRAVWGAAGVDQPEYLRVLVAQLRRKIEPGGEPQYILSEPWVGYRLSPRRSLKNGDAAVQDDRAGPDGRCASLRLLRTTITVVALTESLLAFYSFPTGSDQTHCSDPAAASPGRGRMRWQPRGCVLVGSDPGVASGA